MQKVLDIALIQMSCGPDTNANLQRAIDKVREAAREGASIVCLPELFEYRYFPTDKRLTGAEIATQPIPGPTTDRLSAAAKDNGVYLVGGSIFERAPDGCYNTAVIFDDRGKLIKRYRKCHIPQDPGFYEKDYFGCGDRIEVIETPFGKICVMICFDQWYPEAARMAALQGAQLIIYPTAIGVPDNVENITGDWKEIWQTVQRGHAAANNVYVAAINRVGFEEAADGSNTAFFGGSFLADFAGHVIAQAGNDEAIVLGKCDFERQRRVQEAWRFFPNRRTDLYAPLTKKS